MAARRSPLIGTVVGGVYRVEALVGAGGMGEVYAAQAATGERVAIKVLHERAAQDRDLVARFRREAAIAAQVKSPHIAGIVGAGKEPDGRLWIAFELLTGEGLDERLRRDHYLSFAEVAPIVDDALQGLAAAHEAGVVHRDIKPANLFLEVVTAAGADDDLAERTRILDFGVSKLRSAQPRFSEPSLTAIDATLGSFAYMAPEQVRGSARVDGRADLYALGASAFRALSGRLPFVAPNALSLVALKLDHEAPTLSSTTGDAWPQTIERFFRQMMARDRERRFETADDARVAWRAVCRAMGGAMRLSARPRSDREERTDITTRGMPAEPILEHESAKSRPG